MIIELITPLILATSPMIIPVEPLQYSHETQQVQSQGVLVAQYRPMTAYDDKKTRSYNRRSHDDKKTHSDSGRSHDDKKTHSDSGRSHDDKKTHSDSGRSYEAENDLQQLPHELQQFNDELELD
jgi:hypothetical protein